MHTVTNFRCGFVFVADAHLRTDAYRYELPPELIAQKPAEPADAARLMVVGRCGALEHKTFTDLPSLLGEGDVLVINETRVIRARLHGTREPGGGAAEILLLRPASGGPFSFAERDWLALVKPGRRLRLGASVCFGDDAWAEVVTVRADGVRTVRLAGAMPLETLLERYGAVPLPPYSGPGDLARDARYQTIFARVPGSVAAPTASLHFTPRVIAAIRARGVTIVPLALDVGLGTFRPMEEGSLDEHIMHAEYFAIPQATADTIAAAKAQGRRIIAAGTTVMRALEAVAERHGQVAAVSGDTDLFIRPGFRFRVADALLTNFHLPASTLLVLVTTFGGYERIMAAYGTAIAERYRFFSFGDAMLVSPITP